MDMSARRAEIRLLYYPLGRLDHLKGVSVPFFHAADLSCLLGLHLTLREFLRCLDVQFVRLHHFGVEGETVLEVLEDFRTVFPWFYGAFSQHVVVVELVPAHVE